MTDEVCAAVGKVPARVWTRPMTVTGRSAMARGSPSSPACSTWPPGRKACGSSSARNAPNPGAQLRFTDIGGHRFTCFATSAPTGQPGCSPRSATPADVSHPRLPDLPGRRRTSTRQSGKVKTVTFRWGADKQLGDALCDFAGDSATPAPGPPTSTPRPSPRLRPPPRRPHPGPSLGAYHLALLAGQPPLQPAAHNSLQALLSQDRPVAA